MIKILITTFLIIIAVFLLAAVFGGYYMYRFAIVRKRNNHDYWKKDTPLPRASRLSDEDYAEMSAGAEYIKSQDYELVSIQSHDGLTLYGRIIDAPAARCRGMFIMVHGYRSSSIYDFSCAVRPVLESGFSCLLIDHRACGRSEGKYIGFGVLERYDLVRWCEYVRDRYPDLPVILDGISMGSSTVMMGCELGYPDNVRAMICDCGYITAGAICRLTLKRWFHLPPFPIYYTASAFVRLFAGYSLDELSSADCLRENKIPILMAHGRKDGFVPYYMSEENIKACTNCYAVLFTSDTADHGLAFLRDRDKYLDELTSLLNHAGIQ